MPRKTKELSEEKETKKSTSNVKKGEPKVTSKKEVSAKNKASASNSKKSTKTSSVTAKKTSRKKVSDDKKTTTKKSLNSKSNSKTTKKASATKTKKELSKKSITSKATTSRKNSKKESLVQNEYYDLPYRYNQTVVKVLAQTPNNLFIYWDISDEDRENLKEQYGENFFEVTYPVLIVYNDTLNYSFEVSINDFANSWYLHVNDSKSDYRIELGRRPIDYNKFNENVRTINENISHNVDYIHIYTSNEIESPNDRILFNKEQKMVYYRNVKTNQSFSKPITSISFMQNMGKIYNIYDFYKQLYKEENIEDLYDLSNPSSGNPSSSMPSSGSFR